MARQSRKLNGAKYLLKHMDHRQFNSHSSNIIIMNKHLLYNRFMAHQPFQNSHRRRPKGRHHHQARNMVSKNEKASDYAPNDVNTNLSPYLGIVCLFWFCAYRRSSVAIRATKSANNWVRNSSCARRTFCATNSNWKSSSSSSGEPWLQQSVIFRANQTKSWFWRRWIAFPSATLRLWSSTAGTCKSF